MNVGYLALGGLLLAVAFVDLLWTTLWVDGGAGPLTMRLMASLWRGFRRIGGRRSRLSDLAGPAILASSLVAWLALIWLGWTFLFAGGGETLVDTRDAGPISWSERLYFTGYTIFTLGNGDFAPMDGVWQIATALATASGMLFVTLAVTYVLSVLDAVSQKRAFAMGVSGLGTRGDGVVRTGWNGEDLRDLENSLDTFASQLSTLTANHKAYPILHYFHSAESDRDPTWSVAVLDDALTLLEDGVAESTRPGGPALERMRSGIRNYLRTLDPILRPADRAPPVPDLRSLDEAGVPTVPRDEFVDSVGEGDERRRKLLYLLESNERRWPSAEDD